MGARARARQPRELLRRRHRGGDELRHLVDAADDRGNVRELQLIFFGRESNGEGWLEIEARGGSGVRYRAYDAAEAPAAARGALDR